MEKRTEHYIRQEMGGRYDVVWICHVWPGYLWGISVCAILCEGLFSGGCGIREDDDLMF